MITFTFSNPNSRSVTKIELYREITGTPIPDIPVNPPVQIHDGFVTRIIDSDVVIGTTYDYRIRVFKEGGGAEMGPVVSFKAVSMYGPGGYKEPLEHNPDVILLDYVEDVNLPTIEELLALSGGDMSNALNWTNVWKKVRQREEIVFIPYKGFIEVPKAKISALMGAISANGTFKKGQYTFKYAGRRLNEAALKTVLDGRYPTPYPLTADYPSESPAESAARLDNVPLIGTRVFTYSANESFIWTFSNDVPYTPSKYGYSNVTSDTTGLKWYWKPIISFSPESGIV